MSHTQTYIDALAKEYDSGKATEHSYRRALQDYLEALLEGIHAINEPKPQAWGAPDYLLFKDRNGERIPVGYIEAKDVDKGLNAVEKSSQMKRYLERLDNIILTDYFEFRFFRYQEKVATVRIAETGEFFGDGASVRPLRAEFEKLETLLENFVEFKGQTIKSPMELAKRMANKAKMMREVFFNSLTDTQYRASSLYDQFKAFQQILIHDMDEAQFADVYSQTVAYGLFTARLHDTTLEDFSRAEARDLIPRSNPFLRQLFDYVCGANLEEDLKWIVDELCEVFLATDVNNIMLNFGRKSGREDPVIHFYEDFLKEYDSETRKSRGVWYTPEAVVNFIVRGVDEVLKTHFGLAEGLADTSKVTIEEDIPATDKRRKDGIAKRKVDVHRVQLLDVAAGTGTFTAEAIRQIHARFKGQEGLWNAYVESDLLPRLHGFEILMASYAMCHLKIDLLLRELGYVPQKSSGQKRLGVYLTNALEEHHPETGTLFAQWLAHEANAANRIKKEMPIMVAYGNPPYSVSSQNKGEWIQNLIADYKAGLKEKKLNLDDDYIKFFRYAQHYIERTGKGVVAMITNNSYLDGVTHRQMRKHLLQTFDHIYIIDLHGSAKKKETAPDGSRDVNVFDIQQGVAIAICVKDGSKGAGELATLWHKDMYGARKDKYRRLHSETLAQDGYDALETPKPYYFFVPKDFAAQEEYEKGFGVAELFGVYGSGIKTERDKVCVHHTKQGIENAVFNFLEGHDDKIKKLYSLKKDSRDWTLQGAKNDLLNHKDMNLFTKILYRPFDFRFTYYTGTTRGFMGTPGRKIGNHFREENYGIILSRTVYGSEDWRDIQITNSIVEFGIMATRVGNTAPVFPLYLYPTHDEAQASLEDAAAERGGQETDSALSVSEANRPLRSSGERSRGNHKNRRPNLNERIIRRLAKKLGLTFIPDHENKSNHDCASFTPLDVLDYIYAVLHSPTYRETYKEFLKIDFPRIPYPATAEQFWQLVALGGQVRQLHLLEHADLSTPITTFPESGDCMVDTISKTSFQETEAGCGKVSINETQYFGNVPRIAWEFFIGGYQPAQKWLKDRKGRELSTDDIRHYQKIIVALMRTHEVMQDIDKVWKAAP